MKRILVTGASSGIGRALALRLANRGDRLVVSGRSPEKLDELGIDAMRIPADLTAPGSAAAVVSQASSEMGGLDVVVHCAGIGLIKPASETSDAEFTRVMNVNARATFLVAQEACRVMAAAKSGLFITIPGILGRAPMKNASAYVASKYAVTGLLKCFAQEYQRSGLRFCLFHFGGVDSPFWDSISMAVQREKMIPVDTAVDLILQAIDAPGHLVLSEVVMQPESHQLV
ncbi:MAG: SDR family oxidoreductase [Terrimicrobiaceae bacterium]|nr:SDR family oxidoreductase [Terrimicrobiaceae bacterium]